MTRLIENPSGAATTVVELRMQSNKSVDCQIGLEIFQQFDEPTDPYIDPSKMRDSEAAMRSFFFTGKRSSTLKVRAQLENKGIPE